VKKILMIVLLAATPLVTLASQDPQATPDTGSKAANSHHTRRHHKRSRNSHHAKQHRATKQHSQTQ
jgi:Ni/Co efflux regulator RcnB